MKARSLYVHWPFCERKCQYCDFYSVGLGAAKASGPFSFLGLITAFAGENQLFSSELDSTLDTVFFGGGTPSTLGREHFRLFCDALELSKRMTAQTEFTVEMNPSSVSLPFLKEALACGVNRVSLGVQALQPQLLDWLTRVHGREQALEALDSVFEAGFTDVSADLMCAIPGQTLADLDDSIDELLKRPITHLSCYILTLEEGHRYFKTLPTDDRQWQFYQHLHNRMTDAGFRHYEISNFSREQRDFRGDFRSRHNLNYWGGGAYLGLGPSAHSFSGAGVSVPTRWKNISDWHEYQRRLESGVIPTDWREELNASSLEMERWLLALRLDEGFSRDWLRTAGQKNEADLMMSEGLLELHPQKNDFLRATVRGFALNDSLVLRLVD